MINTPHINALENDFSKTVLMPGDPMRAKFIAENYLMDYKLVNSVRGMLAYTGLYKNKKITVMASGMGMPSMGIYCYELYKYCNVENIIRIGSAGTFDETMNVLDVLLVENSYTEGNFAYNYDSNECNIINSNEKINNVIKNKSKELNMNIKIGNSACGECFDAYTDGGFIKRIPVDLNIKAIEMEAFALFYTANKLNKKASCLLTISDSLVKKQAITAEDRQNSFNQMILLALESGVNL